MPNTLAHIAIQAPLTRLGMKEAPLQWIAVGCIIPDIPWIVQRIFTYLPGIDTRNPQLHTGLFMVLLLRGHTFYHQKSDHRNINEI